MSLRRTLLLAPAPALALALATLVLLARPEPARADRSTPATTVRRGGKKGHAIRREREIRLPAHRHHDATAGLERLIQVREGKNYVVRRVVEDSPIEPDGTFLRRITMRAAFWHAEQRPPLRDPFRPRWSRADVPFLFTTKSLRPEIVRARDSGMVFATLRVRAPLARQVNLVLQDGTSVRMTPDLAGIWEARVSQTDEQLVSTGYHFDVDGHSVDPE